MVTKQIVEDPIQLKFEQFHRDNPVIYTELVKLARQARRAGRDRYSMDLLMAVLRWDWEVTTRRSENFKLNNDYTSRYARLIMKQERDLADFFEIRALRKERGSGKPTTLARPNATAMVQ